MNRPSYKNVPLGGMVVSTLFAVGIVLGVCSALASAGPFGVVLAVLCVVAVCLFVVRSWVLWSFDRS